MCAMISGLFIGSNDGRPPQAYKENLVSLRALKYSDLTHSATGAARRVFEFGVQFQTLRTKDNILSEK